MKETQKKLDHANWLKQILNGTSERTVGICRRFDSSSNWADHYESLKCEHPRVKKFHTELENLVRNMRTDLQTELDNLFK